MKFSYEKLLLGFSGLALLAGILFYVINADKISASSLEIGSVGSNPYEPIPVPVFDDATAVWPNAEEQAPGELYDVFTPPAIWIGRDGTFIFESPIDDQPSIPFGVYLAELRNEPYRIQLEGYVEEDFNDPTKSVLLFYDEEKKERIRARVGESIKEHEFSIFNFTIDRIRGTDGIVKLAVAVVLDFRDGRRIFLTHGERKYKDNVTVVIRSREDPSFEIVISQKPPYEFKTAAGKYVLEEINLEESFVIVKKLGSKDLEPETRKLFPESRDNPKKTSNKSLESKTNTGKQLFDFEF